MTLSELDAKLMRDRSYCTAREKLRTSLPLALHCKTLRLERGLTQKQLATLSGVTVGQLSKMERLDPVPEALFSAILPHLQGPVSKPQSAERSRLRFSPETSRTPQRTGRRFPELASSLVSS